MTICSRCGATTRCEHNAQFGGDVWRCPNGHTFVAHRPFAPPRKQGRQPRPTRVRDLMMTSERRHAVLYALIGGGGGPISAAKLAQQLGWTTHAIGAHLRELGKSGTIARSPHRYHATWRVVA